VGAEQLDGEHQPRTPLAFAQGLQFRRGGSAQGGGEGAQVEAEASVGLAEGDDSGRASDDGAMAMAPFVTQEALKAFTDRLVEAFAPEQVILFGSMARGTAGVESDADVLVVMPFEGRALDKILEIRNVCQPEFPLDMLLWRPEDIPRRYRWGDPFIREALDYGVVLYG
jgi:predicted nucleotidyltransferase